MEPTTAISITLGILHIVNEILAHKKDGPNSILQVCYWPFKQSKKVEPEIELKDIVI